MGSHRIPDCNDQEHDVCHSATPDPHGEPGWMMAMIVMAMMAWMIIPDGGVGGGPRPYDRDDDHDDDNHDLVDVVVLVVCLLSSGYDGCDRGSGSLPVAVMVSTQIPVWMT